MNVDYKHLNLSDVAKMLKVDRATLRSWCLKGYIDYIDVSEPKSNNKRYQFSEDEVSRVKKLMKKYGKKAWVNHCDEGRNEMLYPRADEDDMEIEYCPMIPDPVISEPEPEVEKEEKVVPVKKPSRIQLNVNITENEEKIIAEACADRNISKGEFIKSLINGVVEPKPVPVQTPAPLQAPTPTSAFDADKALNQILRMQDIKERLDNLDAERNQLNNEYAMLRQEILEVI